MKLIYDLSGLSEKEVAAFQTAVIDTLDQLDIPVEYDETSPDLQEYIVVLAEGETMKSKIVFQQLKNFKDQYKVIKLTNRVNPEVGTVLKKAEVQKLLTDVPNLTVDIVPEKK